MTGGFLIEIMYFIIIWIIGTQIYDDIDFDNNDVLGQWQIIFLASITGASMGLHNAIAKEAIPNCPSTTVMTMTLVSIGQFFAHSFDYFLASYGILNLRPSIVKGDGLDKDSTEAAYFTSMKNKYKESYVKFITASKPLVTFIVGGILGSSITKFGAFTSLIVPIIATLVIVLDSFLKIKKDKELNQTMIIEIKQVK